MANPLETIRQELDQQRSIALDQLEAAWQLWVTQIEEKLHGGWKAGLEMAVDERFRAITDVAEQTLRRELERKESELRTTTRAQLGEWLNQSFRRLRRAEAEDEFYPVLAELCEPFCERVALWSVDPEGYRLLAWRCFLEQPSAEPPGVIPLAEAPALRAAAEVGEPIFSEAAADQLSGGLSGFFGNLPESRVLIVPIQVEEKTTALLCASRTDGQVEAGALEALTLFASAALEARLARSYAREATQARRQGRELGELSRADAEMHAAARRFARVRVAEMRLFKSQAVQEGRAKGDLYGALKLEIDAAREAFRNSFITACPTMVDYLHIELVRTLANDDASLLGPEYPGPLV